MGKTWNKFSLLMWKNIKLQVRHPIQTTLLIIVPAIFVAQVLLFRSLVEPIEHPNGKEFPPFDLMLRKQLIKNRVKIAYSPCNNTHLKTIMAETANALDVGVTCKNNAQSLENTLMTDYVQSLCGIQFDDNLANSNDSLPEVMNVTIRFHAELKAVERNKMIFANWHTYFLFPKMSGPGPRDPSSDYGAYPVYREEGFLPVQKELSMAIIRHLIKREKGKEALRSFHEPYIYMQRFPYPPWIEDLLIMPLQSITGLMLVCSFLVSAICTIKSIATEKETKIKEAMKIMGLPNWLHWTAWFIKSFLITFISATLVILLFKVRFNNYAVLTLSNTAVLITLMFFYTCATVALCFAISVFFGQANTAAAVGALIWFLLYFPYGATQLDYNTLSSFEKVCMCLGSNSALALALNIILDFESQGEGIQWSNIWSSTNPEDTLTLGLIITMLTLDTFIYFMIALYTEAVMPGQYGVPKPWYFPFMQSFWLNTRIEPSKKSLGFNSNEESIHLNPLNQFEEEPKDKSAFVQVMNISKYYGKKAAVKNLSLNMYEGEITALLGHNAAGKSTTFFMLTGMIPPSSGTAIINGYDIVHNIAKARQSLGFCPQHNIIFDELTVYEHLYFFGRLKGLNNEEVIPEVERYIDLLDLVPKTKVLASKLSGGMKRKLCIGIALIGKSKAVLLDEPTAGIDPSARRAIWDILQKEKTGRTILLTTHYMDEADLLADRIAVMVSGKIETYGTSFFLKKKFGNGYHLIIEKGTNCDIEKITGVLRQYIPQIQVESNVGSEVVYTLNEKYLSVFEVIFKDLETKKDELKIESFGISSTTLEEVFTNINKNNEDSIIEITDKQNIGGFIFKNSNGIASPKTETKMTGIKLFANQIFATFYKRVLYWYRTWFLFFVQLLVPVVFIVMGIITVRKTLFGKDLPNYDVSFDNYIKPVTIINGSNVYKDVFTKLVGQDTEIIDIHNESLSEFALNTAKTEISHYRTRYILGATFKDNIIKMWFNNEPYHSPPLAVQCVMNTILKKEVGNKFEIRISNFPLPYNLNTKFKFLKGVGSTGLQLATNIGLSMAFVSSFYVLFYVKERVSGAKHLQFVSGTNVFVLWSVSFIWDFILFILLCIALTITLFAFQENGYNTVDDMVKIVIVLMFFAFAALPMTYLFSYFFTIPSSGYTFLAVFKVFTGTMLFTIVKLLNSKELGLQNIGKKMHMAFLIFPHYTLSSSIHNINLVHSQFTMCNNIVDVCKSLEHSIPDLCEPIICAFYPKCCNINEDYYAWSDPGIGKHITYSIIIGLIFIAILLLLEYGVFKWLSYHLTKLFCRMKPFEDDPTEDSDVMLEKEKIRNASKKELNQFSLVMINLSKDYGRLRSVNQLCVGVKEYDCFGLLGANGAGKTTTFKMITGEETITHGEVLTKGFNIKTQRKQTYKVIGYCPQYDELLDNLTLKETLIIFLLLRGVPYKEGKVVAKEMAAYFDFYPHLNKKIKACSGGTRRKLSISLAMIGNPYLIYLDEPTAGMDPTTRRNIWNAVIKARNSGKSIVLTSHSMEECEALCTRLAIMVEGNFKCLGSVQHLKNKFSDGYILTIKVKKNEAAKSDFTEVNHYVNTHFQKVNIKEHHKELLTYSVDSTVPLSKMFNVMENSKNVLNIEDYFIGQCTLEQIMIKICQNN